MRCDEARQLMILRTEEDLPETAVSRLARHLEHCRDCREEADRTAATLEAVRDAWAPQGLPRTPTEIETLLGEHRIEPRRRRRLAFLAAAAALLFAGYLGVRALIPDPLDPLVTEALEAGPPHLLSPNAVPLDDLSLPVLLTMKDGRPHVLACYPFGDGAHAARPLDDLASFPMPEDGRRPDLVICAGADDPWLPLATVAVKLGPGLHLGDRWGELWLAGASGEDALGALPLLAGISEHRDRMADLDPAVRYGASAELRITRRGKTVRYRWGPLPTAEQPHQLRDGDVSLTLAQIDAGNPVALTPLRDWLRDRADTVDESPPSLILLEIGERVRYVDVLRAVECADGNRAVRFWMGWLGVRLDDSGPRLTAPPPAAALILTEHWGLDENAIYLSVDHPGRVISKRRALPTAEVRQMLETRQGPLLLDPDAWASWNSCAPLFGYGHRVRLFFADEPGMPYGRFLEIPPAPPDAKITDVDATRRPTGGLMLTVPLQELAGKLVRPRFPGDAAVEEVLHLLLELRMAGIEVTLDEGRHSER